MLKKSVYKVYYSLFDMHSRGEDQITAAFMAVFTTSLPFWLNIFSIFALLRKIDLMPIFFNKAGSIALGLCLFILNYFLFVHKKKYEKIVQMFKDESKNERRKRGLFVVLYILLSVVAFVLVTMYKPGKL